MIQNELSTYLRVTKLPKLALNTFQSLPQLVLERKVEGPQSMSKLNDLVTSLRCRKISPLINFNHFLPDASYSELSSIAIKSIIEVSLR